MQLITLAIVEDVEEIREGLREFLDADEDFAVIETYGSAEEAKAGLPEANPDIVIMDINLPGASGIECIREVKRRCRHTQFMMFTVYETDEKVFEALKAGASGYLLKKSSFPAVAAALKELHSGGAPMSAHIARKLVSAFHQPDGVLATLSDREGEVLNLLAHGLLYKEIAAQLDITTGTVAQHIHNIYEKLHVQNKTEAINKWLGRR